MFSLQVSKVKRNGIYCFIEWAKVYFLEYLGKKKWFHTDCNMRLLIRSCLFFFIPNSKGIGFSVSLFKQFFLLNYLGQKVNDSGLTVSTQCILQASLLFMNQISEGMRFNVSLNKLYSTLYSLRAKSKRFQTDCINRLHPSPMSSLCIKNQN